MNQAIAAPNIIYFIILSYLLFNRLKILFKVLIIDL